MSRNLGWTRCFPVVLQISSCIGGEEIRQWLEYYMYTIFFVMKNVAGILTSCVAMVLSGVHSWSSIMRDCLTCFCSLQPTMWMYFRMRRLWNSTGGIAWDCRMTCKMLSIIYIHNLCVMHLGPGGHFLDVIWRSFSRLRPCLIIWWLGCMVCMSTHI